MPKNQSLDEFYSTFREEVLCASDTETSGWTTEDFLTNVMMEYLEEAGEVTDPVICPFRGYGLQMNAYAISEDCESVDIFVSIYSESDRPRSVSQADIDAAIKRAIQLYHKAINDLYTAFQKDNDTYEFAITLILGKITAYVDALRLGKTTVDDLTSYTQTAVEIEHIMPQTCADKELYGMNDEDFSVYINRLGNLTLLENSINKSIHNDVYANKSKAYKQSKFYLTSSLSELVNQGHDTAINRTNSLLFAWSDWNKRSIEERQEMLYRLSEMIWEMS